MKTSLSNDFAVEVHKRTLAYLKNLLSIAGNGLEKEELDEYKS